MDWQDIVSMVGIFFLQFIFVAFSHSFAFIMDTELYESNKYNENRKTIRIGCRWIFWRCKKENINEIFLVAFVHQIINIAMLFGLVIELIISILLNIEIVYLIICCVPFFIYCIYCAIFLGAIKKKEKRKYRRW